MQRIIDPLSRWEPDQQQSGDGLAPLEIDGGNLHGIDYRMPIASAQVKSAILLAALQAAARPHWQSRKNRAITPK